MSRAELAYFEWPRACTLLSTREMQRRSNLCIPTNETARHRSQFPHSWICERLYIPKIGPPPPIFCSEIGGPIVGIYINRSQIYECGNWEQGRSVSFLAIFVSNFRYSVFCNVYALFPQHLFFARSVKQVNCWTDAEKRGILMSNPKQDLAKLSSYELHIPQKWFLFCALINSKKAGEPLFKSSNWR